MSPLLLCSHTHSYYVLIFIGAYFVLHTALFICILCAVQPVSKHAVALLTSSRFNQSSHAGKIQGAEPRKTKSQHTSSADDKDTHDQNMFFIRHRFLNMLLVTVIVLSSVYQGGLARHHPLLANWCFHCYFLNKGWLRLSLWITAAFQGISIWIQPMGLMTHFEIYCWIGEVMKMWNRWYLN